MISFDTNILFYAAIDDCDEHAKAALAVKDALRRPSDCMIADQVYFELYRLLRNPSVLRKPFDAPTTASLISWYRERSGFCRCAWEVGFFADLQALWSTEDFKAKRSFDAILAITLRKNGVSRLYSRNVRDFEGCGIEVLDPIG